MTTDKPDPRTGSSLSSDADLDQYLVQLRSKAEQNARTLELHEIDTLSPEEIRRIIHELSVHQIELKMQNEELLRAEEELNASRDRYLDLYENAPVGYCTLSDKGLIVEANLTAAALLGVDRGALIGQPFTMFILNEDQDIYYLHRRHLSEAIPPRTCELRMMRNDGEAYWARLEAIASQDRSGAPVCRVVMSDITERRQAEKDIADVMEINRAIVENSSVGIVIYKASGSCVTANAASANILGTTVEQLRQQNFHEIQSWKQSGLYESAQKALFTGETTTVQSEINTTSGLDLWLHVIFTPFRSSGELCLMTMFEDFTERKQSEERIKASEERYRNLVETTSEFIWEVDPEGRYTYASPRVKDKLGYSPEEVMGLKAFDLMPEKEARRIIPIIQEIFAKRKPISAIENINRHKDGHLVTFETTGVPVLGPNGELKGYRGIGRDVSERKFLEEQLQQSQKMESIGRLAGGVAHDFNNILTAQMGFCELMMLKLRPEDPLAEDLAQIDACVEKAAALTRQLLAFSRRQILQPIVYDLNELVLNLDKMLRRLIGEDLSLVTVMASGPMMVKTDPGQMEQVLVNLAVNARDAMPDGGKLTIALSPVEFVEPYTNGHMGVVPGRYVMLTMSDTGCGMDNETRSHIFEPFFTTKAKGKGTGLGLSTVYGIVNQSGGTIWVYSEPGQGTTFKIYLPQVEAEPAKLTREESRVERGQGELILIVEDDQAICRLIQKLVESLGYRAHVTNNGGVALILIEEQRLRPDLLLTDVVMPGIGGRVLVERIHRTLPDLKVIYMSGYTDDAIVHHGVLEPGIDFLQKPFSMANLASKIKSVLRRE